MKNTIFKNARLLEVESTIGMSNPCDVFIKNGIINRIDADIAVDDDCKVIDAKNNLLMPGLINGHFHSSVNHMKGSLPSLPLEIFMLYESPELECLRPTPREAYLRTMLGCMEMLKCGTTSVQDDCFFVPEPDEAIIDAVVQAYIDSGMRVRLALDQPELDELKKFPFLNEIVPTDIKAKLSKPPKTSAKKLLEFYMYLINKWHGCADGRIKAAVSCSAPQRVSGDYFLRLNDLSESYNLPLYAHMLETRLQRVFGETCLNGKSLVKYANDLGVMSERLNIIHAIWVDDTDLDIISEKGVCIAHNPNSNLRLGSGVMPLRKILDKNIPVFLGVDEAIADDAVNMWSVMKTTGSIHNLTDWNYSTWPSAKEIIISATRNGGRAMREPKLGTLEIGAPADLILVNLQSLPFVPLNNLLRQLVYCELGNSVYLTMVAGKIVSTDQRLSTVNEHEVLLEASEIFEHKKELIMSANLQTDKLLPYYKKMYQLAAEYPLDINRKF